MHPFSLQGRDTGRAGLSNLLVCGVRPGQRSVIQNNQYYQLRCGHLLQMLGYYRLAPPVQLCSKNVGVLVISYFLPFCSCLKHVKPMQNACHLLWFLKRQSCALAFSGSRVSCWVIHRRAHLLILWCPGSVGDGTCTALYLPSSFVSL